MGKDIHPWPFRNLGFGSTVGSPSFGQQQNINSMVFPAYADPYGFFRVNSTLIPPSNSVNGLSGLFPVEKSYLVLDQSGDQTSIIFSSAATHFSSQNPTNQALDLLGSDETYVTNGNGTEEEEMHEDTEEIDALLYSDSDDDKEEASTGHSPFETMTAGGITEEEEVASSSVPAMAAKRRRVFDDPSLIDTASSVGAHHVCGNYDGESSWVGNGQGRSKRLKRQRIQETVGVLRRIIPGGKGKDAAAVLDEAIRYLRSLKLKAKGLGAPNL